MLIFKFKDSGVQIFEVTISPIIGVICLFSSFCLQDILNRLTVYIIFLKIDSNLLGTNNNNS